MRKNRYRTAITREPSPIFDQCISDHPLKRHLNIGHARQQHAMYCQTLADLGLEIIKLQKDNQHPDACFVEDTAVIHEKKAFIGRMLLDSRRGEELAVIDALKSHFKIAVAKEPAFLEGGDVVHFDNKLICGLTQRTNEEGVKQLKEFLSTHIESIHLPEIVHLKSYLNYLGKNTVIVSEYYANHPIIEKYQRIIIPKTETYATNVLAIGNVILMVKNYPKSLKLVQEAGFEVITLDISEITKCNGALTCLSILF